MTENAPSKKRVVIVGGGFAGVQAALELSKNHRDFAITLISDQPNFRYYPALYHTATGGLYSQSNIPLSDIVDEKYVTIIQDKVMKLDRRAQTVTTAGGQTLSYEILIIGIGVVINYFGIEGLEENTYGIKTHEHVRRFKTHIHSEIDKDKEQHYVIVGAGPTGIELAGALPTYLDIVMRNHNVQGKKPRITIVEAAPRLLPRSPEKISRAVQKRLEKLGIELKLGQTVEGATADSLMVNGQPISSHTIVWTAGTANNPFFKQNNFALGERGKVVVDGSLRSEEAIYVIGDNADTPFSGVAQTAMHDGRFAAQDIVARAKGQALKPYRPEKPIVFIPVGQGWAAVEWGNKVFTGWLGWRLQQAADWRNFHDMQPWWRASEQWMTEFGNQEECPVCAPK